MKLDYQNLGLVDYSQALQVQESLVEKRFKGEAPDTVLFCSHPSVVTLGRSADAQDLQGWKGDVVEVSRGGRATYHGPGQIIIYPILDLRSEKRKNIRPRDIMSYLETFEKSILVSLQDFGLKEVYLKEDESFDKNGKKLLNRGLWFEGKKVAAFGIAIRKWISFHGCAINLERDPNSFQGIKPCGYEESAVGYVGDYVDQGEFTSTGGQRSAFEEIIKEHLNKDFI